MFEEQIQIFKTCGTLLLEYGYEALEVEQLLDFIVSIETELWRARIKIERETNR